ncbi:MFS transporter [Enemella sp. A6]|uniref:MFS transporter n=1 Tax=Enemella sp. A6 TaxID=3440152 RepID=UPI003EBF1283
MSQLRRARWAVAATFFTNGFAIANLVPRYPEIKAALELTNTGFGTAIAFLPIGSIVAGLAAGHLVARFTSARVATIGMVLLSAAVLGAGIAGHGVLLAAMLFLVGACDAIADVAQNAHGLRVERAMGRAILNSLHASWSAGAVTGGLFGAAAAGFAIPLPVHLVAATVLVAVAMFWALRFMLAGADTKPEEAGAGGRERPGRGGTMRLVVALGLVAGASLLIEDVSAAWSTIWLADWLGAAPGLAGMGFVAGAGMQFVGRLVADRAVDRFGDRAVARAGGALVLAGGVLVLGVATVPASIIGFGLAGFGVASLVPAAYREADLIPGLPPGRGLTMVSWLLRFASMVAPPVIGMVADLWSLRAGLLVIVLAGVLAVLFSRALPGRAGAAGPTGTAG